MSAIAKFDAVRDLAARYQIDADAFLLTIRAQSMPAPHSDSELVSCLLVAREHGLNPLTKEIYFMRSKGGPIQPIVSVDGWMRKCNEHPQFDGVEFESVKQGDEIVALTCRMHRKDRSRPIEVTEYLEECRQAGGPVWKSSPMRMLRNRTYCQAARMAFGFAGIMEPDEFQQWQATDAPIELTATDPAATLTTRDGGTLPRGGRRPSSSASKETGGEKPFQELMQSVGEAQSIDELYALYDAHERGGTAWASLPAGWARMVQDEYHYRLRDLEAEQPQEEDDEPLTDEAGFLESLADEIAVAQSQDDIRELTEVRVDLIKRCSPDGQDRANAMLTEAMAAFMEDAQ